MHVTSAIAASWVAGVADKRLIPFAIGATVYGVAERFIQEEVAEKVVLGAAVAATAGTFYTAYTRTNLK